MSAASITIGGADHFLTGPIVEAVELSEIVLSIGFSRTGGLQYDNKEQYQERSSYEQRMLSAAKYGTHTPYYSSCLLSNTHNVRAYHVEH